MGNSAKPTLATLMFLVRQHEGVRQVLLGIKKQGRGSGMWNAPGGKVEEGESVEEAAKRETFEEIGVRPTNVDECARINFKFPQDPDIKFYVHAYCCESWEGGPTPSKELDTLTWFDVDKVPYSNMWKADREWIDMILDGKKVVGEVSFDAHRNVLASSFEAVEGFDDPEVSL